MARSKRDKNGATPPEWQAAANASAERDAADKRQGKLKLDSDDVRETKEDVELPHELTETEVRHIEQQNTERQYRIDALEKEIADFCKPRRAEIKTLEKELSKGAKEAHTKTRHMLVPVRVEHDYRVFAKRYYRMDRGDREIGELYDTQPMNGEEREQAVFEPPTGEAITVPAKDEEPS